jgi:hypothetical protein
MIDTPLDVYAECSVTLTLRASGAGYPLLHRASRIDRDVEVEEVSHVEAQAD